MKKKILVLLIVALITIFIFPMPALAYSNDGGVTNYNDNDYYKLRTFLEAESDVAGVKNGERLSAYYDPDDPTMWPGVFWNSDAEKRVTYVGGGQNWNFKSLAGNLDLSGFTSLVSVTCENNSLTGIDASGDTALQELSCLNNDITSLDITSASSLTKLDCSNNSLTSLDISGSTALTVLYCQYNQISSLDVTAHMLLSRLACFDNPIQTLDVSNNAQLTDLYCGNTGISTLDVSNCTLLWFLYCEDNDLTSLDLSNNAQLMDLRCGNNSLPSLDLSSNTQLEELMCEDNEIASLDLSALGDDLEDLDCSGNHIASLDLSAVAGLEKLLCSDNDLTALDLSANTDIYMLVCADNDISSLDLTGLGDLETLYCENNALSSLDLSLCPWIDEINCTGNTLSHFEMTLDGTDIKLTADGSGYVGFNANWDEEYVTHYYFAEAVPISPAAFVNWTEGGSEASTDAKFDLTEDQDYDITAHFLSLSSSVSGGKIYTGGRITLTPNIDGGTWDWDEDYFTATFNSPATFTALKAGTSRITYTLGGASTYYDVTIGESGLPETGQDSTWVWTLAALALGLAAAAILFGLHKREKHAPNR